MGDIPEVLRKQLRDFGQEHVLAWWPHLDEDQRRTLLAQLQEIDLQQIRQLYQQRDTLQSVPPVNAIQPIPADQLEDTDRATRELGEEALRRGEVAALVVAGGQGTRLGSDDPKGMFPIGPVSGHSLFQIHAEKVLALGRRYGRPVPLLVMTSPVTDQKTREFFAQHQYFGLPAAEVFFFCQGTMPAVDMASGRLLLDGRGSLALSPNGHGGMLPALSGSGLLQRLQDRGVRHLFYFQIDNPLVKVADPLFLGHHTARRAEVSSKVIPKLTPEDRLGNVALVDGRCHIIEYSDLKELANLRDEQQRLVFRIGSPAIHIFDVDFLARVSRDPSSLPFHIARKKVPHVDEVGNRVEPTQENGYKFEMFIFDVLPRAARWTVVATTHEEEFAPLKNAKDDDSPAMVHRAMIHRARRWLEQAGVRVEGPTGGGEAVVEISPLLALGPEELAGKLNGQLKVEEPVFLQ